MKKRLLSTLAVTTILVACGVSSQKMMDHAEDTASIVPVKEVFESGDFTGAEIDSLALWRNPADYAQSLLLVTGKSDHRIHVLDGISGATMRSIGGMGSDPVMFNRPNGVAVVDDLAFIVERDNRRVQVLRLPELEHVGFFGAPHLKDPYGLTILPAGGGRYTVYVTDDYPVKLQLAGTTQELAERVKQFDVMVDGSVTAELERQFGEIDGPGRLLTVESICADPVMKKLYICDEEEDSLKVYTLDGKFTGTIIGDDIIRDDAEGVILVDGTDGGWIVVSDQGPEQTRLRVFTRKEGSYIGAVTGSGGLANTDGIAFSQGDLGPSFPGGVLYAVNDDLSVQAFAWENIASSVGIQ